MLIRVEYGNRTEYHVTNSISFDTENKKLILCSVEVDLNDAESVLVNGTIEYSAADA